MQTRCANQHSQPFRLCVGGVVSAGALAGHSGLREANSRLWAAAMAANSGSVIGAMLVPRCAVVVWGRSGSRVDTVLEDSWIALTLAAFTTHSI